MLGMQYAVLHGFVSFHAGGRAESLSVVDREPLLSLGKVIPASFGPTCCLR